MITNADNVVAAVAYNFVADAVAKITAIDVAIHKSFFFTLSDEGIFILWLIYHFTCIVLTFLCITELSYLIRNWFWSSILQIVIFVIGKQMILKVFSETGISKRFVTPRKYNKKIIVFESNVSYNFIIMRQ